MLAIIVGPLIVFFWHRPEYILGILNMPTENRYGTIKYISK